MTKTKTDDHDNKGEGLATKAKDGIAAVTNTAKDIAAKVADGASTLLDATKQKAKEAKRAIRDGVIHTNDKLEDLTDKID